MTDFTHALAPLARPLKIRDVDEIYKWDLKERCSSCSKCVTLATATVSDCEIKMMITVTTKRRVTSLPGGGFVLR